MKNKIFPLIFLVLLSLVVPVVSVFAQEYSYVVTVTYGWTGGGDQIAAEKYTVLASSASEAETKATKQWEAMKKPHWIFKYANAQKTNDSEATTSANSAGNNEPQEYKYRVVITFVFDNAPPLGPQRASMAYTVSASSPSEAQSKAVAEWNAKRLRHWLGIETVGQAERLE